MPRQLIETIAIAGCRRFGPNPLATDIAAGDTAVVGSDAWETAALLQVLPSLLGATPAQGTTQRAERPSARAFGFPHHEIWHL